MDVNIQVTARMHSDFATKFGIPRQSGLVQELRSTIVFEPAYRNSDALRGIEEFSHLWIIWQFSEAVRRGWSPTVRPPRLGGNTRMGVFATRSPFRPNNLGLSSVRLLGVEQTAEYGTVLHVGGADLMDGTPIFDIKPYIPYGDCHPEATGGFTDRAGEFLLKVEFPPQLLKKYDGRLCGTQKHDHVYGSDIDTFIEHIHRENHFDFSGFQFINGNASVF